MIAFRQSQTPLLLQGQILKWRRALRALHDLVVKYHFTMSHDFMGVISCSFFFFFVCLWLR